MAHAPLDQALDDTSPVTLGEKLSRASTKADGLHDSFLPDSKLFGLVTPTTVERELYRCRSRFRTWGLRRGPGCTAQSLEELAAVICGDGNELSKSYRRIFAILAMMGQPWKVCNFVRHGNDDSGLPYEGRESFGIKKVRYYRLMPNSYPSILEPPRTKGKAPEGQTEPHHGKRSEQKPPSKPKALGCFRRWMPSKKRQFEKDQWKVRAPFFARSSDPDNPIRRYDLPDKAVLPFTLWQWHGSGGASHVFKVRIHPAHHAFEREGSKVRAFPLPGNEISASSAVRAAPRFPPR